MVFECVIASMMHGNSSAGLGIKEGPSLGWLILSETCGAMFILRSARTGAAVHGALAGAAAGYGDQARPAHAQLRLGRGTAFCGSSRGSESGQQVEPVAGKGTHACLGVVPAFTNLAFAKVGPAGGAQLQAWTCSEGAVHTNHLFDLRGDSGCAEGKQGLGWVEA